MKITKRKVLWTLLSILLVGSVTAGVLAYRISKRVDVEDIKAAMAARHVKDPRARLERFLEARYGSLDNPTNRQKVFLRFFSEDHIKTTKVIVEHSPKSQRQTNVMCMANWLANYRQNMSSNEVADLRKKLSTPEGRTMVQQATALYLSQNAQYRDVTSPVVHEILETLKTLQNP